MVTINASLEAHRKILHQRHKMEEEGGKVVPTADALDVLLKVKEDV
jgi:hypothetical protein